MSAYEIGLYSLLVAIVALIVTAVGVYLQHRQGRVRNEHFEKDPLIEDIQRLKKDRQASAATAIGAAVTIEEGVHHHSGGPAPLPDPDHVESSSGIFRFLGALWNSTGH